MAELGSGEVGPVKLGIRCKLKVQGITGAQFAGCEHTTRRQRIRCSVAGNVYLYDNVFLKHIYRISRSKCGEFSCIEMVCHENMLGTAMDCLLKSRDCGYFNLWSLSIAKLQRFRGDLQAPLRTKQQGRPEGHAECFRLAPPFMHSPKHLHTRCHVKRYVPCHGQWRTEPEDAHGGRQLPRPSFSRLPLDNRSTDFKVCVAVAIGLGGYRGVCAP